MRMNNGTVFKSGALYLVCCCEEGGRSWHFEVCGGGRRSRFPSSSFEIAKQSASGRRPSFLLGERLRVEQLGAATARATVPNYSHS